MIINEQELHKAITEVLGVAIHREITVTFDELKQIYQKLLTAEGFFPISFLHRDDIKHRGYDVSNIDNETMVHLADQMDDSYLECGFWEDLDHACERLEIPKIKDKNE